MDCHEDRHDTLLGSPHQIVANAEGEAIVACTDCHIGSESHYEDDPEENPMTNPAKVDALVAKQICSTCHTNSHQQNMHERNVHTDNDINCSACHQVHAKAEDDEAFGGGQYPATQYAGLLKKNEVDLCLDCHMDVRGQFAKPYRHPVNDGVVKCSECHMTLDLTSRRGSFQGTSDPCLICHSQFQGPFPHEHQATVDYSTEEGACLNCHEPHGSHLPRMLKQPFESPNFELCTGCHMVPGHNFNTNHGTQWAGVPCNDCHVDIHGSYVSTRFFDPALQSQGCFNVGCHKF